MENKTNQNTNYHNYKISKTQAKTRVLEWQNKQDIIKTNLANNNLPTNSNVLNVEAFTFRLQDIVELVNRIYSANHAIDPNNTAGLQLNTPTGQEEVNSIRFYIGERISLTNSNAVEPCLIALGAEDIDWAPTNQTPPLPPTSGGKDVYDLPTAPGSALDSPAIYDFSFPCPATCPEAGYGISDS